MTTYLFYSKAPIDIPKMLNGCTVVLSLESLSAAWRSGQYPSDSIMVICDNRSQPVLHFLEGLPPGNLPARICIINSNIFSSFWIWRRIPRVLMKPSMRVYMYITLNLLVTYA